MRSCQARTMHIGVTSSTMIAMAKRASPPGRKLEFACFTAAFHPRILVQCTERKQDH